MRLVVVFGALTLLLAGCSGSEAGTAVPGPTAGGETSTPGLPSGTANNQGSGDRHGAPQVANPLDATRYLTQPCAALTTQQLQGFDLPVQGRPDTDSAVARNSGPGCTWTNSDIAETVGVGFLTGNKNGLVDLYRANDEGTWKGYWEETTVSGYPAAFHFTTDARPQGSCNLAVGISDTLAFRVTEQGRLKGQSCDRAKQIAAAVVATVKAGG